MDSTELHRRLLGVTSPWTVEKVEMSVHDVRVDVYLKHTEGARFACPGGAQQGSCSSHQHKPSDRGA